MMNTRIGQKHLSNFEMMKKNVENSREYFYKNFERYQFFQRFVFDTSLSTSDKTKLDELKKPPLEFNSLESKISRLRGEFIKHEPSLNLKPAEGVILEDLTPEFLRTQDILEGHLREIFFDASNDPYTMGNA